MNDLFESINSLFTSNKRVILEGYSLGDDRESFNVWDEEEKKLEEIVDYVKEYCDLDFSNIKVEHSQDSITSADFTLKNLPEAILNNSELEEELYEKYAGWGGLFDNVQIENWGEPICILGFDIDLAYRSKYKLGSSVKDIYEKLINLTK